MRLGHKADRVFESQVRKCVDHGQFGAIRKTLRKLPAPKRCDQRPRGKIRRLRKQSTIRAKKKRDTPKDPPARCNHEQKSFCGVNPAEQRHAYSTSKSAESFRKNRQIDERSPGLEAYLLG